MKWMQLQTFSGSLNGWLEKRVSPACDNVHIGGNGAGYSFSFLAEGQRGGRAGRNA